MPDFTWVPVPIKKPEPRRFVVNYLGVQSVFIEDLTNPGQFHGHVNGLRVLVEFVPGKYSISIDAPDGRICLKGPAWEISFLEVPIRNAIADIFTPTMYERFRNHLPYTYTATETGFFLVYQEIYIIRFTDDSGWCYATGIDPTDWDTNHSVAYTPDITPSMEHCIAAFTQGEFHV